MVLFQIIAAIIAAVTITGCSGSGGGSSSATYTNEITEIFSTLSTNIDSVTGILDATTVAVNAKHVNSLSEIIITPYAAFSTAWSTTTPGFPDRATSGAAISGKDYMGDQLDGDLRTSDGGGINAFGRMKDAFGIFCALGVAAAANGDSVDANGYLANGSYTVTFTTAVKSAMDSNCGMDTSNIPTGTEVVATVTTGSTNYDKVITFDFFDQTYMVTNSSTVLRIATAENSDSNDDDTADSYSRTLAEYNKSTGVTKVQYTTHSTNSGSSVEVFRLYFDETNDEGMIMGYHGNTTDIDQGVRYIVAGKPTAGDALSLSLYSDDAFGNATSREACVMSATGDIDTVTDTDGDKCTGSSTRLAGADIASSDTVLDNFFGTTPANWGTSGLTDSDVVPFTNMTDLPTDAITP
jgi:hypothetical protein